MNRLEVQVVYSPCQVFRKSRFLLDECLIDEQFCWCARQLGLPLLNLSPQWPKIPLHSVHSNCQTRASISMPCPSINLTPVLDVIDPNILSNTRWRCDHGWDIDLDDGSSNYRIYNNLCLNGGLKLREGFYRICENNVLVGNSLHAHVWFNDSHDVFRSNILCTPYRPIRMREWTQQIDYNLLHDPDRRTPTPAKPLQALSRHDERSLEGDARFIDIAAGNYDVQPQSPAPQLGFANFDMHAFGVQAPDLKAIARTPELPPLGDPNRSLSTGCAAGP